MRVTRIERSWIEGSQVSGCDKEESSVFGFEGMGVNAKALTPVNALAFREHSKEKCIVYRRVEILYKCL